MVTPSQRKEIAFRGRKESSASIRLLFNVFSISESCYQYDAKLSTKNQLIADWLVRLTQTHKRCVFSYLRNVKALLGITNGFFESTVYLS